MKRTRTEIFIEVEETIAFHFGERIRDQRQDVIDDRKTQQGNCPHCGQEVLKLKKKKEEGE